MSKENRQKERNFPVHEEPSRNASLPPPTGRKPPPTPSKPPPTPSKK